MQCKKEKFNVLLIIFIYKKQSRVKDVNSGKNITNDKYYLHSSYQLDKNIDEFIIKNILR